MENRQLVTRAFIIVGALVCCISIYLAATTSGRIVGDAIAFVATCFAVACLAPIAGLVFTRIKPPWSKSTTGLWLLWASLSVMIFVGFGLFCALRFSVGS